METFAWRRSASRLPLRCFIKRNKRILHLTFASLCLGLFLEKRGLFEGIFPNDFWKTLHVLGLLVIPPLLIAFSAFSSAQQGTFEGPAPYAGLGSLITAAVYFPLLFHRPYAVGILYLYVGVALAYCLGMLVQRYTTPPQRRAEAVDLCAVAAPPRAS